MKIEESYLELIDRHTEEVRRAVDGHSRHMEVMIQRQRLELVELFVASQPHDFALDVVEILKAPLRGFEKEMGTVDGDDARCLMRMLDRLLEKLHGKDVARPRG